MTNNNYKNLTSNIIGRLCLEQHPDCENEIDAVDSHSKDLYKIIQLKLAANIPAADDIEFYFILCSARRDLYKQKFIDAIISPKTNDSY